MRNITSALHNPQQTQTYPAQRKKKAPLLPGRTCAYFITITTYEFHQNTHSQILLLNF